ncbi:hypothetical protein EW145_g94 [Phellinidium pouzarii]|uniref:N-acetyltransferase domain-containing protein n=1 Tax=Phellinidium pouzarii TaxID=167371 RepID=A0A4S4LQ68_9AGAM|nr:hypothetical protein EW145_g94 [Phellinidium pouzarii]
MITTPHNVNEKEGPRVEPLRLEHLDNVYDTINAAFKDDPMSKYINEGTKEPGPRGRAVLKRIWKSVYGHSIKRRLTYTVNAGDAIIVATPAEEDIAKPSPIDSAIDFFLQAFENLFGHLTEQNKRSQELKRKVKKLSEENLGDSAKDMIHINLLATRPESQGNGYGTALD